MKRLFIVYNPRSSRYSDVKNDVLGQLKDLKGYIIGKYEIDETNVEENVAKFKKILRDGDLVISAGGDATGVIAVNAILESEKDVTLAVLPYGNFNDLSRTLGTKTFEGIFKSVSWASGRAEGTPIEPSGEMGEAAKTGPAQRFYPIEIYVDDKFFRYATCYVTIGMTAEAVKLYDEPRMRKVLKTAQGRNVGSYTNLAGWYFKNRHKKIFLPDFKLNGKLQPKKSSDYAAINGKYMARVMKGRNDYKDPKVFRSEVDKLTNFWRLFRLMFKSMLFRVPGSETKGDVLEFLNPATVEIQAEGEYKTFQNIKKIELRKGNKCLKVITKN